MNVRTNIKFDKCLAKKKSKAGCHWIVAILCCLFIYARLDDNINISGQTVR